MATGGLLTFRDNAVYIGWAKQAAWGTGLAPTNWWIWRDGSDVVTNKNVTIEREGDQSGFASLPYVDRATGMIKIIEYARPIVLGCALQSLLGTGSDAFTATVNTTLGVQATAGATTITSIADLGNTGNQGVVLEGGVASTNLEAILLNKTTRTGTGPWVYTLANAATVQRTHVNGSTVTAGSHVWTPKYAYDPYCIEVGYGEPGSGVTQVIRYIDCYCVDLNITSSKGKPVIAEHTWYAGRTQFIGTSLAAVTLPTGAPFKHTDASGLWLMAGAVTNNAATIEQFRLQLKRSETAEDFQSEGINSVFAIPGNIDISGSLSAIFNSFNDYNLMYYGAASPAANTTDSPVVGVNSVQVTYQQDALNSLLISLPNVNYQSAPLKPSLKGSGIRQPITFTASKNPPLGVVAPLAMTLLNSQMAVY